MAVVKFFKVGALPGTLEPNAFYFVENGSYAESYLTDDAGVAHEVGNSVMIQALADSRIAVAHQGTYLDYPQPSPLATWSITHNLGEYPNVTVVDQLGEEMFADITHVDENEVQIDFSVPVAGRAIFVT